jgi:hypothetical protein
LRRRGTSAGAELLLALELLVGAVLELLHGRERAALLDTDLTLLGGHGFLESTPSVSTPGAPRRRHGAAIGRGGPPIGLNSQP